METYAEALKMREEKAAVTPVTPEEKNEFHKLMRGEVEQLNILLKKELPADVRKGAEDFLEIF